MSEPRHEQAKLLGDNRGSQVLRIVTLVLVVAVLGGVLTFGRSIGNLNTDDQLINRGQQVNSCIGDRQDAIDQWRAVATFEFTNQVDRLSDGLDVSTVGAEAAEAAIYALVDEKQELRDQQLDLIEADDPSAEFHCTPIDDDLMPPELDR